MKSRTFRLLVGLGATAAGLALLVLYALAGSYVYLYPSLPTLDAMRGVATQVPLRVYTRDGELIGQFGDKRLIPVSYDQIPPLVREAFVAAEDDRFWQHHGIDYFGMVRALFVDISSREFSQGASTITMQAARNMFLTPEKTVRRKLQEVFVTLRMEREFSKQQILNTYLNVIFFGQRAYGVAAAAEVYFGKPLSDLTLAEAATLGGLPQAPSRYNPVTNPKEATRRRHYVLQRMVALRFVDAGTAAQADAEPMHAREYALRIDVEASYVAEMARQEIVNRFGEAAVNNGYRVITTLDGRLQTVADRALRLGLISYDRRHGYRGPIRTVPFEAGAPTSRFEQQLQGLGDVGILHPAIVISVAPTAARVYVRSIGFAQIDADGLNWAHAPGSPAVRRGDIVYVIADDKGNAQLAQLPEVQGAMVALNPNDGAITALVGGFDYYTNAFNRITQAKRQPGSGFKPFLYSAALEHGVTPASIWMDAPPYISDDKGAEQSWRPQNSGGSTDFLGPIRFREALVRSRNLVSIRVLRTVGADDVVSYASRFGFDAATMPHTESLALGSLSASPLQVVTGYAAFANGGYKIDPYFIDRIEDYTGQVVYKSTPKVVCANCPAPAGSLPATPVAPAADPAAATDHDAPAPAPAAIPPDGPVPPSSWLPSLTPETLRAPRIITPQNDWLMDDMMADVIKRGTGVRARVLNRNDIAGKTGTTNLDRDAWFNGFNQQIVATVWVGFDQDLPLGEKEEGSFTAVPIWINFMREALRGTPDLPRPRPDGLVSLKVSAHSGLVGGANEPDAINEWFLADHLPPDALAPQQPPTKNPEGGQSLF
ncbi:MAG TPA: PBP1A family penicillin-binding protein [Steroidobacteraceae bacterium]